MLLPRCQAAQMVLFNDPVSLQFRQLGHEPPTRSETSKPWERSSETLRILTIHPQSRDFETFQARRALLQVVDICCQIAEIARLLFVEMAWKMVRSALSQTLVVSMLIFSVRLSVVVVLFSALLDHDYHFYSGTFSDGTSVTSDTLTVKGGKEHCCRDF